MKTSEWWNKKCQRMRRFIKASMTPQEAVFYAQTSGATAFDHRRGYKDSVVRFKLRELLNRFGKLPDVKDSEYSIPSTVGPDGYSNMFLTHLYFYLTIMRYYHSGVPERILEIGGGYGGLARIFKTLHPEIQYTIVDLEESLYFSKHFLELNGIYDVRYTSSENLKNLEAEPFALAINTFSFQEMPYKTVKEYVDFIEKVLIVGNLYTCNYFQNNIVTGEQSYDLDLPINKDIWFVKYAESNAPILTVDSPKNFRELFLERLVAIG